MDGTIPFPVIYQYRCTGCGTCIARCPVGALARRNEKAVLAHPELCIYCTLCEDVCPEDAIALPFLVRFAEEHEEMGHGYD